MRLGFIGTGTISAAVIEGLQRVGVPHEIVVSPRSQAMSTALAARFAKVRRAASNAEVAEQSDIVFLAMRPPQVDEALAGVKFGAGQIVVSFVANLPLTELGRLIPGVRLGRAVPLPGIARGRGPILSFPEIEEVGRLLEPLGDLVIAASEAELVTMTGVSAFMASYFELQLSLARGLERQGVPLAKAGLYVRSLLAALADTAALTPEERQAGLPEEHATKGGLNERVRKHLLDAGWFEEPQRAFAAIRLLSRNTLE